MNWLCLIIDLINVDVYKKLNSTLYGLFLFLYKNVEFYKKSQLVLLISQS